MNILIDASASYLYHSTGIGAYASELISEIKRQNFAANISLFTGNDIISLMEEKELRHETFNDFWERISQKRLPPLKDFDIYHNLHNGIAIKNGAKKSIITIHDMIPLVYPQYCGSPYKELFLAEARESAEKADAIITVSENSKRDILRFTDVKEERIHVIYEAPKHLCKPLPETMTANYLRSRYRLKPPFFLYVGGFNHRKNVAGLIRSYAKVYREFPKICPLVIIGREGSRRRELERLAEELSVKQYISFIGYVPDGDLPFFYNQCEALIYPSFYEGFGLPPLEAAACGAAVITSNRSSLPEIMKDGAIYIDADSPQNIGEQLLAIVSDPMLKKTMQAKSLIRAEEFSYSKTAEQTLSVYENICR